METQGTFLATFRTTIKGWEVFVHLSTCLLMHQPVRNLRRRQIFGVPGSGIPLQTSR